MEIPEATFDNIDKFFSGLLTWAKPTLMELPESQRQFITDVLIQIFLAGIMQFITKPVKQGPDWVKIAEQNWNQFPSKYLN